MHHLTSSKLPYMQLNNIFPSHTYTHVKKPNCSFKCNVLKHKPPKIGLKTLQFLIQLN
ncbi:hypothetical protein Hanom_Chr16g01415921 [Helianthus anomalus]